MIVIACNFNTAISKEIDRAYSPGKHSPVTLSRPATSQ